MVTIKATAYADQEDVKVVGLGNNYQQLLIQLIEGINSQGIDTENYELSLEDDGMDEITDSKEEVNNE